MATVREIWSRAGGLAGPGDSQVRVNSPCGREALQPETIGLRHRCVAIVRTHAQLSRVRPGRCRSAVAPSERRRQLRRRPVGRQRGSRARAILSQDEREPARRRPGRAGRNSRDDPRRRSLERRRAQFLRGQRRCLARDRALDANRHAAEHPAAALSRAARRRQDISSRARWPRPWACPTPNIRWRWPTIPASSSGTRCRGAARGPAL